MPTNEERHIIAEEMRQRMLEGYSFTALNIAEEIGVYEEDYDDPYLYEEACWKRLASLIDLEKTDPEKDNDISLSSSDSNNEIEVEDLQEDIYPKTFQDLWFMRETSNGWFNGQIKYENVRGNNPPEAGVIDSKTWHVIPYISGVEIQLFTHIISDVSSNGQTMSFRIECETIDEYNSMEEFRNSKWWNLTMEEFANGDVDASWLNFIHVNEKKIFDNDCGWIAYSPSTLISMEIARTYHDWLNNYRYEKGHDTLDINVDRISGEINLLYKEYNIASTVEEIAQALKLANKLKELKISLDDDHISIPINKVEKDFKTFLEEEIEKNEQRM